MFPVPLADPLPIPLTITHARFVRVRCLPKWLAGRVLRSAIRIPAMLKRNVSTTLAVFFAATLLSACGRSEKEYQKLVEENARLKAQLERLAGSGNKELATPSDAPELNLSMAELWDKRFEDINDFRARKLLSNKTIRIAGQVESVTDDSVSIYGSSKRFGTIRMTINLMPGYAVRVRGGLALLEKGATVFVQGRFAYERMGVDDAVFVNPETGKTLYSDNLAVAGSGGTSSTGVPSANSNQPK
jgi:hypothetical protein